MMGRIKDESEIENGAFGAIKAKKIAIVHDQLYTIGGAEKVLRHLCQMFPNADVFCIFNLLNDSELSYLMGERRPRTSFIQRLPFLERLRRIYFFLMPIAIEQISLHDYDIIVSSSYLVAKGAIAAPDQIHICYLHSPMRYAWDQQETYVEQIPSVLGFRRKLVRLMLHYLRAWDSRSSNGVDHLLANSRYIARRAAKAYRRDAIVLYPPVDLDLYREIAAGRRRDDVFVTMSRLVEGKRVDLLLEAFRQMPDLTLEIIGDGDLRARLEERAPANVRFLGRLGDREAAETMAAASGFVYAAEEDFGITPVEAQAAGTPVVALGAGGTAETVRDLFGSQDAPTGVLFDRQEAGEIARAVRILQKNRAAFTDAACRRNAERFSSERFRRRFRAEVERAVLHHSKAYSDTEEPHLPVLNYV